MTTMATLLRFFLLFFLLFPSTRSSPDCQLDCVSFKKFCGKEENELPLCKHTNEACCICDEPSQSRVKGWTFFYYPKCSDFNTLFQVTYDEEKSITFECGEYEPPYKSVLHQVNLTGIKQFIFQSCPLPSTSYRDIIPYQEQYPVEYIKIETTQGNKTFSSELFGNLSFTVTNLVLKRNNFESLPENVFSNFTKLELLYLNDNKLKELPQNIFINTTSLRFLEITNNLLESLPEKVFQSLNKLERLSIYKNKLKQLPGAIFKSLSKLEVLELNENYLTVLPEGIFSGLSNLHQIRLHSNLLSVLANDLFHDCRNLNYIDLSTNPSIESLPENLLTNVTQLEKIFISHCKLTNIHANFFMNCPNLKIVNLKGNKLTTLPETLFKNNSMLKEINLNDNNLNQLPNTLFPNQTQLEKFSICKNNISSVPDELFQHARNLKKLDMGRNHIKSASKSLFRNVPGLEELVLSRNNLSNFELVGILMSKIKKIDLSYNNVTKLPNIEWFNHVELGELNLEHNNINFASIPIVYSSKERNPKLKLANNKITAVSVQTITQYEELMNINALMIDEKTEKKPSRAQVDVELESNPFSCDCKLYELYNYIQSKTSEKKSANFDDAQSLMCHEPINMSGKRIISLSPKEFVCEMQENCPHPCECYYRTHDNSNVLNCSYRGLALLPTLIPQNINVFLFQGNSLNDIKDFNTENWKNLTELYLDNNMIQDIFNWSLPVNLKNLSLTGNNISYVPHSFMDSISNHREIKLSMGSNPFNCNCSVIDFKKWLAEQSHIIADVKEIMCDNHVNINGTLVNSVIITTPDNVLCPSDDSTYKLHLIFVTVTCVILACLLVLVSALYYRNKQTVIAYVYIHMYQVFTCFFSEEDLDEDKMFDAFLSYSTSDREIALSIREELEDKDPHFRVCIHERNWIAGNPISWNIFNSVQNSKRTILLISKEFLESMWFQVEFHTAYYQMLEDKIDRLIIIVKGELPPKETMDKDLQYLLTTKTYLLWEEKWFWEKLKYALPHKKHQLVPNDVLALKDRPASEKVKPIETQIAILSNGGNKTSGKLQEVIQNHTNSTMNLVNKDSLMKK